MADEWLEQWQAALKNPWLFISDFANTWDEHEKDGEIAICKPFPKRAMLRIICRAFVESHILFIEKSRQIMMSWDMAALFLWDSFHPSRRIFFQSKKDEDAQAILERSRHIYDHLRQLGLPGLPKAKMTAGKIGTAKKLSFPAINSLIEAIPQGAGQSLSYTLSGIFGDEMNHQPKFEEGFEAMVPTLSSAGRGMFVGTPNGYTAAWRMAYGIAKGQHEPPEPPRVHSQPDDAGRWERIPKLFKEPKGLNNEERRWWIEREILNLSEEDFQKIPLVDLIAEMPGMAYWVTHEGGHSMSVHYTADPCKDPVTKVGAKWVEDERERVPKEGMWRRQYEISYETPQGMPVIENWSRKTFVPGATIDYQPSYPIFGSVDFGTILCGCIFGQVITLPDSHYRQLRILMEIILQNSHTPALARAIKERLALRYPEVYPGHVKLWCDPAGNFPHSTSSDKSRMTDIQVLQRSGLRTDYKRYGVPESTDFMKSVFLSFYDVAKDDKRQREPAILIDQSCTYMISVFGGGLVYPNVPTTRMFAEGTLDGHYEKDGYYDHGGDMARHLICNLLTANDLTGTEPYMVMRQPIRQRGSGRIIGLSHPQKTRMKTVREIASA